MPSKSRAQNRFMHWAAAHPDQARKEGMDPGVAQDFLAADHGRKVGKLPEHVQKKSTGGAVRAPKPFRW